MYYRTRNWRTLLHELIYINSMKICTACYNLELLVNHCVKFRDGLLQIDGALGFFKEASLVFQRGIHSFLVLDFMSRT
jgi:hypothetical protein